MTASANPYTREYLQITEESAYGTIVASPVRGTSQIPIRLSGSNMFTMRSKPVKVNIPYGGGVAVDVATISDKQEIKGTLQTELCYTQASFLLNWALTRINAGGTAPWTTSESPGQFASCTVDHGIIYDDTGTFKLTRYTGVKVDAGKIEGSADSQKVMLSLDLIAGDFAGNTYDSTSDPTNVAFPLPLDTEFPTDFALFLHSNGGLFLNSGSARAECTGFGVNWTNNHKAKYFNNRFVQRLRSFGSQYKFDLDNVLLSTTDDRPAFYQVAALSEAKVVLTNTTHTLTFDWKTNAFIDDLGDTLTIDDLYSRKSTVASRWDASTNTNFAFTFA